MRCQRCGQELSPLRQLTDRDFCSESCKKRGPRASAAEVRDIDFEEDDAFWKHANSPIRKQQSKTSTATLAGLIVGLIVAMGAAKYYFPDKASGPNPLASRLPTAQPSLPKAKSVQAATSGPSWVNWIQNKLPGDKPIRVHAAFEGQLKDWSDNAAGWNVQKGLAHPGRLQLWTPTVNSRDYTMEFRGSVEKKALSWAFRAKDARNYYAAKLVVGRAGDANAGSIVRYGVLDSKEFGRLELPIPLVLKANQSYRVQIQVAGSQFSTLVDGTLVDSWTDQRIASGGVGFFTDPGEAAAIEWADFRERKGWLTSLMAATFFLPPGATF